MNVRHDLPANGANISCQTVYVNGVYQRFIALATSTHGRTNDFVYQVAGLDHVKLQDISNIPSMKCHIP